MAAILEEGYTTTGYQVRVRLVGGRERTFHWLAKPADVQEAADKAETDLKYGEIAAYRRAKYGEESGKWLR